MKTYLKPLQLCWGREACCLIEAGLAGRLAGYDCLSFGAVELIERDGDHVKSRFVAYRDLPKSLNLSYIEAKRAPLYGLSFDQRPRLMGIINVTPDSFSDGGQFLEASAAIEQGRLLRAQGADILDIGGESTRPGAQTISIDQELARILPVIEELSDQIISVDTRKMPVMRQAYKKGAHIINDVSALSYDHDALAFVAQERLPVVLVHAQGDPATMQINPTYSHAALDVYDYLAARIDACLAAGIDREKIIVDPGFGFGKSLTHNVDILHQLTLFHGLGTALLVGISRKQMIGALTGRAHAAERDYGSVGGALYAALHGAHILRVHNIEANLDALNVFLTEADFGLEHDLKSA